MLSEPELVIAEFKLVYTYLWLNFACVLSHVICDMCLVCHVMCDVSCVMCLLTKVVKGKVR